MPPAEATRTGIHPDANARNAGIDLLRGLAIVLVVFNHLGLRIPLRKTAPAEVLLGMLRRESRPDMPRTRAAPKGYNGRAGADARGNTA